MLKDLVVTLAVKLRIHRWQSALAQLLWRSSTGNKLKCGAHTLITPPFYCGNPDRIQIGSNCRIGELSSFHVIPNEDGSYGKITLGNNITITRGLQIYSGLQVMIEDSVLFASNAFISDCTHQISDPSIPYKDAPLVQHSSIHIGRGSWIGQNAVILPGATIGEQCVIGANSVVKSPIPAYSMAVGTPAKVIKKFCPVSKAWVSTKAEG